MSFSGGVSLFEASAGLLVFRFDHFAHCESGARGYVAGGHSRLAHLGAGHVAGKPVKVDSYRRRQLRPVALREQGGDHSGQHIARAGRGHARIACGIEGDAARGAHGSGVVALEHDEDAVIARHLHSLEQEQKTSIPRSYI